MDDPKREGSAGLVEEALAARDWPTAYELLLTEDADGGLAGRGLESLAKASPSPSPS